MMKKTLSFLLALIMIIGMVPVTAVQASSSDDIYIEEGSSVSGLDNSAEQTIEPNPTAPEQEDSTPVGMSPVLDLTDTEKLNCSCGSDEEDLMLHSDSCIVKQSCIERCADSALVIYDDWYCIGSVERAFIKDYLAQHDPQKLEELQKFWNGDMIQDGYDIEIEDQSQKFTSTASGQLGDVVVDASGVPEGSSLTVENASKKATNAVKDAVAELGENPEQLFLYDISVHNDESDDWQPQGDSVDVRLTIPGVKLHKHSIVYVIHVDDDGNTSTISASVNEDGTICFETGGFSTFAGFTVDFKYGDAFFSIEGLSNIKLSALLDELRIPLYASDVADLTFSDETLVSVTRLEEEEDFLLTSLQAFTSQESLTVTMKDGNSFVVNVTDATAFIYVGGGGYGKGTRYDTDGNQICTWYADGDGELDSQSYLNSAQNDGWSRTNTIYIGGSGTFTIGIVPFVNVYSREKAFILLNQIRVCGNVNLVVYLTDDFNSTTITQVHLQCASDSNLFIIEDGASLTLKGLAKTSSKGPCYLTLDGWNDDIRGLGYDRAAVGLLPDNGKDNQLILLTDGATGLDCNYVRFEDAPRSAIRIANGEMAGSGNRFKTLKLTNCYFSGDVRRENKANNPYTGSGGAIYLQETANKMDGTQHYTWMDKIQIENTTFYGCYAAESGGAIGIYGRVKDIQITGCSFIRTHANRGFGGAILMAGHSSTMKITDTTFDGCSATANGGAVYICSRVMWDANNNYSRLNELTVSGCTFKNSGGIANSKTVNSPIGGGMSIESSINKISITGTTFNGMKGGDGGGLSFGYINMTDESKTSPGEYTFMSNDNFTTTQNALKSWRPTTQSNGNVVWQWRSTLGDISMSNCDFINTDATNQGGGLHFRTHSSARQVIMDDVNFNGCHAFGDGSAVMLGDTIIPDFQFKNSIIQNCNTSASDPNYSGGTFRTLGNTTCVASFNKVTFKNNLSHCSGGGIYWNASGTRELYAGTAINTAVSVTSCTFDGNSAGWYGGGIYCEAVMTVTSCELKNNVAVLRGGGIGLQLYNNSVRMLPNGSVTNLTLDSATNIHHNYSKTGGGISVRANATQAIDNDKPYGHTLQFTLGGAQIHHNYARSNGGGVLFNVESYDTSTETGNSNQQEVERFNKMINLDSGSVYSNIAGENGGGIYMNGGKLTDPQDTSTGQLTSNGFVTITLSGAAIYDNEAGRTATGITVSADDVLPPTVSRTTDSSGNIKFTKSTASATGGNGGGIYLYGDKGLCVITGGVIGATKNSDGTPGTAKKNIATRNANGSGGCGGGIAIFGHGRIEMDGGHIVYNMAETAGGGIAVHDESSMYLNSGNIKFNESHIGGGISLNNAKPYKATSSQDKEKYGIFLNGGTISQNYVTPDTTRNGVAYGGGICISSASTAKIKDGLIEKNSAASTTAGTTFAAGQEGGGVAVCEGAEFFIAGGKISENKAYDGGGIVLRGESSITMEGTSVTTNGTKVYSGSIEDNMAPHYGAGIAMISNGKGNMTMSEGYIARNQCKFPDGTNNGSSLGGGIFVGRGNSFTLEGGMLEGNTAYSGGAILAWYATKITIEDGIVKDNKATYRFGGAIYNDYSDIVINGGEFTGNEAHQNGGAIFNYGTSSDKYKLTINDGILKENKALGNISGTGNGGAICNDGVGIFTLSGGTFTSNTAASSGGGVFSQGSTFTLGDATFTSNKADLNAGGMYVKGGSMNVEGGTFKQNAARRGEGGGASFVGTTGTFKNGEFEDNAAAFGGGMHMEDCTITFESGTFTDNKSNQGAGLFIRGGNTIIDDLTVTGNRCQADDRFVTNSNCYGGGLLVDSNTGATYVIINDASFEQNYAPYGGGIWMKNITSYAERTVVMDIYGGTFKQNEAVYDGGGIYVHGGGHYTEELQTKLTVYGGTIEMNTAAGNGGGVCATQYAQVQVMATKVNANGKEQIITAGMITKNNAKNGGGVFVSGGADLLVDNGYITYNRAISPEKPTTVLKTGHYAKTQDLYGAGGGICVARGITSTTTDYSTFTLQGTSMAVYGNEAGFIGDDVFSDAAATKLTIPLVKDMNLAGYGLKPEGWFEDYCAGDIFYMQGTNMAKAWDNPFDRYRNALPHQRKDMHILPQYVTGSTPIVDNACCVNDYNAYVAMTLGIPAAVDDVVVMDFGLDLNIDIQKNDQFITTADFASDSSGNACSMVGRTRPADVESPINGVYFSNSKPSGYGRDAVSCTNINAYNGQSGLLTIQTRNMQFSKENTFYYCVKHKDTWYFGGVTVVPATSIYYEDNHAKVKYWTDSESTDKLASWRTTGTAITGGQSEDRPGASVLGDQDKDNLYGFDGVYEATKTHSYGVAHYVNVFRNHDCLDKNFDNLCDLCKQSVIHSWVDKDSNGACDTCKNTQHHDCSTDTNSDNKCDICGGWKVHVCLDENSDYKCDICSGWMEHDFIDQKSDKLCDICSAKQHHTCVDANHDNKCDNCSRFFEHTCVDSNKNHYCDVCSNRCHRNNANARASFTFTGTAFDIISVCNQKTGIVMASVYKGTVTDFDNPPKDSYVTSYMVDTHFGYVQDSEGNWELDTRATSTLYQVPVIKADLTKVVDTVTDNNNDGILEYTYKDWGHGTYSVELYIAPAFLEREPGYWGSTFYLDGIRIYSPAGKSGTESETVLNTYKLDEEAWPEYTELRNMIIKRNDLNTPGGVSGIIFVDGKTVNQGSTITEYTSWGPNNEVYLAKNKSVAFKVRSSDYAKNVASIQIGMRGLTTACGVKVEYSTGTSGTKTVLMERTLSTTDMYYDISLKDSDGNLGILDKVITITNTSNRSIAITNLKVTHIAKPQYGSNKSRSLLRVDQETARIALAMLDAEDLADPIVEPKYPALSFNGMVCYNVFFSADQLGDLTNADLGLAVFSTEDKNGTVETAREVIMGATKIDDLYMIETSGIHAKYLADKQYFKVFARRADGSYVYSKMVSYSALDYAENVMMRSDNTQLKQLLVAMLNYGAEAQKFFQYNTDDLMNRYLSTGNQSLLDDIDLTTLNTAGKVDASKVGAFASSGGFTKKSPAISFKGAFEINYFFTPAHAVDGDMTLYFWNEDTYMSADELTAENADKAVAMTLNNGSYTATSDEIIAKDLDKTVYVAAVYESDGVTYCSGVLPYSIATYCKNPPAAVSDLATAAAIYGCAAKQYFGV